MTDPNRLTPPAAEPVNAPLTIERPPLPWYHKVYAILFVTFCLEIGFFLLIFPWTEYWDHNYFSSLGPFLRGYWENTYVRGAVSGLGVINLYVGFIEAFRLRRFARH